MMDALSPLLGSSGTLMPRSIAGNGRADGKVQTEFLTLFYKELLKQVFKAPDLSMGEKDEKNNNLMSAYNSDLMAEKMAEMLAQKAIASQQWSLPGAQGGEGQ